MAKKGGRGRPKIVSLPDLEAMGAAKAFAGEKFTPAELQALVKAGGGKKGHGLDEAQLRAKFAQLVDDAADATEAAPAAAPKAATPKAMSLQEQLDAALDNYEQLAAGIDRDAPDPEGLQRLDEAMAKVQALSDQLDAQSAEAAPQNLAADAVTSADDSLPPTGGEAETAPPPAPVAEPNEPGRRQDRAPGFAYEAPLRRQDTPPESVLGGLMADEAPAANAGVPTPERAAAEVQKIQQSAASNPPDSTPPAPEPDLVLDESQIDPPATDPLGGLMDDGPVTGNDTFLVDRGYQPYDPAPLGPQYVAGPDPEYVDAYGPLEGREPGTPAVEVPDEYARIMSDPRTQGVVQLTTSELSPTYTPLSGLLDSYTVDAFGNSATTTPPGPEPFTLNPDTRARREAMVTAANTPGMRFARAARKTASAAAAPVVNFARNRPKTFAAAATGAALAAPFGPAVGQSFAKKYGQALDYFYSDSEEQQPPVQPRLGDLSPETRALLRSIP